MIIKEAKTLEDIIKVYTQAEKKYGVVDGIRNYRVETHEDRDISVAVIYLTDYKGNEYEVIRNRCPRGQNFKAFIEGKLYSIVFAWNIGNTVGVRLSSHDLISKPQLLFRITHAKSKGKTVAPKVSFTIIKVLRVQCSCGKEYTEHENEENSWYNLAGVIKGEASLVCESCGLTLKV